MSANEFFINKFCSLLASSSWYSSCFRPSSKVIYGRDDVFISLCSLRERSNEVDSYSFPWCRSRNWKKFILFPNFSVDLTLMTRLYVSFNFLIHLWPIILHSHFLHYLGSS